MKYGITVLFAAFLFLSGCVQKTYKKTVVFELNTAGMENIQTVGIRGNGKPLSWKQDFEMTEVKKDSLYRAVVTGVTGYRFTEVKFTINGEFELKNENNRRVDFANGDTTVYKAVFNKN